MNGQSCLAYSFRTNEHNNSLARTAYRNLKDFDDSLGQQDLASIVISLLLFFSYRRMGAHVQFWGRYHLNIRLCRVHIRLVSRTSCLFYSCIQLGNSLGQTMFVPIRGLTSTRFVLRYVWSDIEQINSHRLRPIESV